MKVSEMINKLTDILNEYGDLPIFCVWTQYNQKENEEYTINEIPFIYNAESLNQIWITY